MNLSKTSSMEKEFKNIEDDIDVSEDSNIFGLNILESDASIVLLPVPWEGTASYHKGTKDSYKTIRQASHYIDLYDPYFKKVYLSGIYMEENPKEFNYSCHDSTDRINEISESINKTVYDYSIKQLNNNKYLGLIGGEHSIPYGFIKALSEFRSKNTKDPSFSILHIDAHHDLRKDYEGYKYSHASIMYRIMEDFKDINLVSVGVRDFCHKEYQYAKSTPRIDCFYDHEIFQSKQNGSSFLSITKDILSKLKSDVYIAFDIDGLDPGLCPKTGTPVPGGMNFNEASYLLYELSKQKRVIGFDLSEVGVSDNLWDENIAARILYKLCGATAYSNKLYDINK